MKLAIGFVHPDNVSAWFMHSLLRARERLAFTYLPEHSGARIDHGRNKVVRQFLATDCDRLLFVDADMVFGPAQIARLCAHDAPIIAGLYFIGSAYECYPTIMHPTPDGERVREWARGQVVETDATGCGFLLVKREVFEKTGEPWFQWNGEGDLGEDVYFCHLARAVGYRILIDTSIQLGHVKVKPLTLADFDGTTPRQQDRRGDFFPE